MLILSRNATLSIQSASHCLWNTSLQSTRTQIQLETNTGVVASATYQEKPESLDLCRDDCC